MGVGEPLLNLKLLEEFYNNELYIKEVLGYEIINYAIATMMPTKLDKLIKLFTNLNIPLKLHFSLHTPINEDRIKLIPSTKVNVEEALSGLVQFRDALQANNKIMNKYKYFHRTNDPVEVHYTLIENVNDSKKALELICDLLKRYRIPIKFIRFNPINDLHISKREDLWVSTIRNNVKDLRVKTYSPPGREIGSSCGEFTKHYYHEEIETPQQLQEFKDWKTRHQIFEEI